MLLVPRIFAFTLLALFSLTACNTTGISPFTKQDLINGFESVAFGREFDDRDNPYVIKFDQPINVLVIHEHNDRQTSVYVRRTIEYISASYNAPEFALTVDRPSTRMRGLDARSFQIVVTAMGNEDYESFIEGVTDSLFDDDAEVVELFLTTRCGLFFGDEDGALTTSYVFLDPKNMKELHEPCVLEEMLQGLGLPDDDERLVWSIFNDHNDLEYPGVFDQLLISILYAPELKPGMDRKTAMALVPGIVDRLWVKYLASRDAKAAG